MSQLKAEKTIIQPENMSIYEAQEIQETFAAALMKFENIEVDLINVAEIDSAGLQLMIALKNDAIKLTKNISFTNFSSEVVDLLELFDVSHLFSDTGVIDN